MALREREFIAAQAWVQTICSIHSLPVMDYTRSGMYLPQQAVVKILFQQQSMFIQNPHHHLLLTQISVLIKAQRSRIARRSLREPSIPGIGTLAMLRMLPTRMEIHLQKHIPTLITIQFAW